MELPTLNLAGKTIQVIPDGPKAVHTFIEGVARQRSLVGDERAFYVTNLGDVIEKYRQWRRLLPNVTPFYAVKCNNDPVLMSVLAQLGAGFDCASQQEIQQVLEQLEIPVPPSRIVYANPIKQNSFIRYAAEKGVEIMTFDCAEELVKIKAHHPKAQLIVRVNPSRQLDNNTSESGEMAFKFGCSEQEAVHLLKVAEQLELDVIGVSFYAGHRCFVPSVYDDCISTSRAVFDAAAASCPRLQLKLLDIGGGFYGEWKTARFSFPEAASTINSALERHFGDRIAAGKVQVIAEPGAYMASTSCTLVTNVIGVRRSNGNRYAEKDDGKGIDHSSINGSEGAHDVIEDDDDDDKALTGKSHKEHINYYVNDGIYGSMRLYEFHHKKQNEQNDLPHRITASQFESGSEDSQANKSKKTYSSTIWGPTCDGLDYVVESCQLERAEVGDWLAFKDTGLYSFSMASEFNGMPFPLRFYVIERKYVDDLNAI